MAVLPDPGPFLFSPLPLLPSRRHRLSPMCFSQAPVWVGAKEQIAGVIAPSPSSASKEETWRGSALIPGREPSSQVAIRQGPLLGASSRVRGGGVGPVLRTGLWLQRGLLGVQWGLRKPFPFSQRLYPL